MMAAFSLAVGQIEDMAKDSADRSARCVQDTKRLAFDNRHDQSQRSMRPARAGAATGHSTGHGIGASAPRITRILTKVSARLRASMVNKT
jgi:hypothetical protein